MPFTNKNSAYSYCQTQQAHTHNTTCKESRPECACASRLGDSSLTSLYTCTSCLIFSYTENVSVASIAAYNKEIIENVLRHNGSLIAE